MFDKPLNPHDILQLSDSHAIAGFFAELGYNTNARVEQKPENLGITAESTLRHIRKIELVADQDGFFQVYLFELRSVTITQTRELTRAFRNTAGNFLLVLTSDYSSFDFVLVDKETAEEKSGRSQIGQRQIRIQPRTVTVDRRNPGPKELRLLRRLTWTESDPFFQFDKLKFAYDAAYWSEEHFNNRALFSDHFLTDPECLPKLPEWKEDPKPCYQRLNQLYLETVDRIRNRKEIDLRRQLIEPVFQALGFQFRLGKPSGGDQLEPDYLLSSPADANPAALALVYPWAGSLDGKDSERDSESPEENPGAAVVSLLEQRETPWVIVTNGKLWRLYAKQADSRSTNYYEIDLQEILARKDVSEAFRYFWLFFRSN